MQRVRAGKMEDDVFTMLIILIRSNPCFCLLQVAQVKTFDSLCNCLFTPGHHGPWAVGLLLAKPHYNQLNILGYFNFLTTRGILWTSGFVSGCFFHTTGRWAICVPFNPNLGDQMFSSMSFSADTHTLGCSESCELSEVLKSMVPKSGWGKGATNLLAQSHSSGICSLNFSNAQFSV